MVCSIEYWPDPQRGIREAYRVLKNGGKACLIGPVHPTFWLSRFFADVWMLFPTEEEYIDWFTKAGFSEVQLKRIGPKWYRGVRRHGLIMGCSVTGVKTESGDSPLQVLLIFLAVTKLIPGRSLCVWQIVGPAPCIISNLFSDMSPPLAFYQNLVFTFHWRQIP